MHDTFSLADVEREFLGAMCEAGLAPASPYTLVGDGSLKRFRVEGDPPRTKNGAYCLFLDEHPAGWFMSWKTSQGKPIVWKYGSDQVDTQTRVKILQGYEESKKKREKEMARQAREAAVRAAEIWSEAVEVPKEEPLDYLKKKRVSPLGIRMVSKEFFLESVEGKKFPIKKGTLVVPLWSFEKKIVSLQFICADGSKFFLPWGRAARGWFCIIGDLKQATSMVICEGWATGATVHLLSGLPVVCAMNAVGLLKATVGMRKGYPEREILIAADNDHKTNGNPGITKAREAAKEAGALVLIPDFSSESDGTDWNDLYVAKGKDEAKALFLQKLEEARFAARGEKEETEKYEEIIYSDVSNARLLIALYGEDLRFCHAWRDQGWLVWDGKIWKERMSPLVTRKAISAVETLCEKRDAIYDDKQRDELDKFIKRSLSGSAITSMKNIARDLEGIPVYPEELDANPWLVNCLGGTLDIKHRQIRPHTREDLLTKIAPVEYDPEAICPAWDAFLQQIMGGSEEMVEYLQKAVGYSMTGSTEEHCLFVLYGTGRNGKSTFLNTIRCMFGDYARQAATDAFMAKRVGNSGPSDEIAALRGARFVTAIETDEGQRLAEALVKQLTGGDTVTVRRLYENFFEFKPEFKLFLATNHKPKIHGTDNAIWRRIRLIPFTLSLTEDEVDKGLPEKLHREMSGIFAWAVRGAFKWLQNGLGIPKIVYEATQEYRSEQDVVGRFLEECCIIGEENHVYSSNLYKTYSEWCEDTGERKMSQTALGRRLGEKGFVRRKGARGSRIWNGIGLEEEEDCIFMDKGEAQHV